MEKKVDSKKTWIEGNTGEPELIMAVIHMQPDIVKDLLKNGANKNVKSNKLFINVDKTRMTPLEIANLFDRMLHYKPYPQLWWIASVEHYGVEEQRKRVKKIIDLLK